MTRYLLIIFRENGYRWDRCSGGKEDETDVLLERISSTNRAKIVDALADSLFRGSEEQRLRRSMRGGYYEERAHYLYVNGCEYEPDVEDWWVYDCEDEQSAHKDGKAIFAEANEAIHKKIEAARAEELRKIEEEAERNRQFILNRDRKELERLTRQRDELAKKLGVAS